MKPEEKIEKLEENNNKKTPKIAIYAVIITGAILLLLLLAYLISKDVLTLVFSLFSFFAIGAIILLIYLFKHLYKKSKDEPEKEIFKMELKINSNNMINWAKEYMQVNFMTEFELIEKRVVQVGEYGKRTPIGIMKVFATTTNKIYHIFVNFFEPDKFNTIVPGIMDSREIQDCINGLSYAPYFQPKRITRKTLSDGTNLETEEDIFKENVKEVVTTK